LAVQCKNPLKDVPRRNVQRIAEKVKSDKGKGKNKIREIAEIRGYF
jgi:hypothetical protein